MISERIQWIIVLLLALILLLVGVVCYNKDNFTQVAKPKVVQQCCSCDEGNVNGSKTLKESFSSDSAQKPSLNDPMVQGEMCTNPIICKYFKDTGADVTQSINGRRNLLACESCINDKETPNACNLCVSYVKGHDLVKSGV